MWKKSVVGASVLLIAGSMIVYAQQRPGGPGEFGEPGASGGTSSFSRPGGFGGSGGFGGPGGFSRSGDWRPSAEDRAAFADARIAALHAGLKLSADQEKNWPPFEQALRDLSKMRMERLAAARAEQPPADSAAPRAPAERNMAERNPIERLQRRADAMLSRGTALKKLGDSAAPLYQSLDDAQKRRFALLAHFMRPGMGHHRMGMMWRHGGQGGSEGFGMRGYGGGEYGFGHRRFGGGDDGIRGQGGPDMRGGMGGDSGGMGERMRGPRSMHEDDDYRGPL